MIQFTEKATNKIKEIATGEELDLSIRLQVKGGGCAGMINDIMFDNIVSDMDEIIIQDDIKIIIDQLSFCYLDGTTIDYLSGEFESGFKFLSDKIKSTCGCGKSATYI